MIHQVYYNAYSKDKKQSVFPDFGANNKGFRWGGDKIFGKYIALYFFKDQITRT